MLYNSEKVHNYALKKDKFITVSINITPKVSPKKIPKKKKAKLRDKKISKQITKKSVVRKKSIIKPDMQDVVNEDISSLFSKVKTTEIKHKKRVLKRRKIDSGVLNKVEKKIKTIDSKKSPKDSLTKKIEQLELQSDKVSLISKNSSSASQVNKYLATLQAFVYENFYPPINSEGNSAKIRIWIDENSKMQRFKVLASSGNTLFDQEVKALENRLKNIRFPAHPLKKAIVIDIILTAKE